MEIEEFKKRLEDISHISDLSRANFDAGMYRRQREVEEQEMKSKKMKDEVKEQKEKVKRLKDEMNELREKHDEKVKRLKDEMVELQVKQYEMVTKLYEEKYALQEKLSTAKKDNIDINTDRKRLRLELDEL